VAGAVVSSINLSRRVVRSEATALRLAAIGGHVKLVELLIAAGSNIAFNGCGLYAERSANRYPPV
jgi:ankyrin repeat protein